MSKLVSKNKVLKGKINSLTNEKNILANEFIEIIPKFQIPNENFMKLKNDEKEVATLRDLDTQLKNEITQLKWYKEKYENSFTHGEEKFERLFKMGKYHRGKTGLGYNKEIKHNPNISTKFVKGEGSSSNQNISETACQFYGYKGESSKTHFNSHRNKQAKTFIIKIQLISPLHKN